MLVLCLGLAYAQETVQNSSFQELMNDFAMLQERHNANQVLLVKLGNDLRELPKAPTPEEYMKKALKLQKRLASANADIQRENEAQVFFKNSVTRYSGSHTLLKQEQTYLSLYLDSLQKFGREQNRAATQVRQATQRLNSEIANVPPPKEFTCSQGIAFILVSPNCYITKTPITAEQFVSLKKATAPELSEQDLENLQKHFTNEGITQNDARWTANTLGRICGFPCALPHEDQLKFLKQYALTLNQAIWLDGKATIAPQEKEALQRFGMTMARVWDPRGCLATPSKGEDIVNELPWMNYPMLGCALVTDASAGRNAMLAEIELLIAEEEANALENESKRDGQTEGTLNPDQTEESQDAPNDVKALQE